MIDLGRMEVVKASHRRRPQIDRLAIPVVARQLLGAVLLHHGLDGIGHDLGMRPSMSLPSKMALRSS